MKRACHVSVKSQYVTFFSVFMSDSAPDMITRQKSRFAAGAILLLAWVGSGCAPVSVQQQRLVSKPNMVFSDSGVFANQLKLPLQTEPGATMAGGARANGCTSCK